MNDDDSSCFSLTFDIRDEAFPGSAPESDLVESWLTGALSTQCSDAEVCLYLVDIEEMTQLNHEYRQKVGPTNILSFIYDSPPGKRMVLGDLVVCPPILEQEATAAEVSVTAHWAHLIVHGALHLVGYDHQNDDDAEIMEGLETSILLKLGYQNPYQNYHE